MLSLQKDTLRWHSSEMHNLCSISSRVLSVRHRKDNTVTHKMRLQILFKKESNTSRLKLHPLHLHINSVYSRGLGTVTGLYGPVLQTEQNWYCTLYSNKKKLGLTSLKNKQETFQRAGLGGVCNLSSWEMEAKQLCKLEANQDCLVRPFLQKQKKQNKNKQI